MTRGDRTGGAGRTRLQNDNPESWVHDRKVLLVRGRLGLTGSLDLDVLTSRD